MSGYFKRMAQLARSTLVHISPAHTDRVIAPTLPADPVMPKSAPARQQDTQQPSEPLQPEARKTVASMQKPPGKTSSAVASIETAPAQEIDGDIAGIDAFPVFRQGISLPQLAPSITYTAAAEKQASSAPPRPSPRQVAHARDDPLPRAGTLRTSQLAAVPPAPAKKPEQKNNPSALRQMEIPPPKPGAATSAKTRQNNASPQIQTSPDPVWPEAVIASAQPAPVRPDEAAHPLASDAMTAAMAAIAQPPAHLLAPGNPPSFEVNIGAISVELGPDREAREVIETPAIRPAPKRQHTGIWSGARDLTRNYIRGA